MIDATPIVTKTVTHTTTLELELSASQVKDIIKEWAKTQGFSHRVVIEFQTYKDGRFNSAYLTERTLLTTLKSPES